MTQMLSENDFKPIICENCDQTVHHKGLRRNVTFSSLGTAVFYSTVRSRTVLWERRSCPTNSDLQQASPHRDRHCVRTVVCSQLVHEVLYVEVDSGLGNCELIGNLLVTIAIPDKAQDFQIPVRKIVVGHMLGQTCRYLRWYMAFAGVD